MWYKVLADGSEIDIVYANSPQEAITIAKIRQDAQNDVVTVWTTKSYY